MHINSAGVKTVSQQKVGKLDQGLFLGHSESVETVSDTSGKWARKSSTHESSLKKSLQFRLSKASANAIT